MSTPLIFDRKSSIYSSKDEICRPLFPFVRDIYRKSCTAEAIALARSNEKYLAEVCHDSQTPKKAKGAMFELMVIRRLYAADLSHTVLPPRSDFTGYFDGEEFPPMNQDGMWIPTDDQVPAVDFLWKYSDEYWGVQMHTGMNHVDVAVQFGKKCDEAGLVGKTIHLIWLSQNDEIASWARRCLVPSQQGEQAQKKVRESTSRQRPKVFIQVHALHVGELGACMDDFPWTNNN